jgi:hypothetical protein
VTGEGLELVVTDSKEVLELDVDDVEHAARTSYLVPSSRPGKLKT